MLIYVALIRRILIHKLSSSHTKKYEEIWKIWKIEGTFERAHEVKNYKSSDQY